MCFRRRLNINHQFTHLSTYVHSNLRIIRLYSTINYSFSELSKMIALELKTVHNCIYLYVLVSITKAFVEALDELQYYTTTSSLDKT